jgi:putative hydrolase of the HAD superfamily
MLKTIYFDLGNVLIFFSPAKMFDQIAQCTGLNPPQVKQALYDTDLRERYEKGLIDTEHLYRSFLKQSPHPFSLHDFMSSFANIFTPNTDLWPLVMALKRQNVRLILLSNTSECHFNYAYSHYPILHQFDHKILSYEVGLWKPDTRIFQKALTHSHCFPEECFYIDDIPDFIASARKAGLPGATFTDVPTLKKQLIQLGCDFP